MELCPLGDGAWHSAFSRKIVAFSEVSERSLGIFFKMAAYDFSDTSNLDIFQGGKS